MRLLLSLVVLASAVPVMGEPFVLRARPDGTPDMVVDRAALRKMAVRPQVAPQLEFAADLWCDKPGNMGYCLEVMRRLNFFDFERIPVKATALEIAPASRELARVSLPARLDTTTRIPELKRLFNQRELFISTAFDRDNKVYFAFFNGKPGEEVMEPEGGRLLKSKIPVTLDASTKYVISLEINIFDPERSKLVFSPERGFPGKTHKIPASDAMKAISGAGVPVAFSKGKLQFFYAHDADPKTKKLASTRTLSFVKEAGRDTKYYTIRDEDLPKDKWSSVDLGGQAALLFRTADDGLLIHEPN